MNSALFQMSFDMNILTNAELLTGVDKGTVFATSRVDPQGVVVGCGVV